MALASSTPKHGTPPFLDTSHTTPQFLHRVHWYQDGDVWIFECPLKNTSKLEVFKLVPGEGWMSRWKLGSMVSKRVIAYL